MLSRSAACRLKRPQGARHSAPSERIPCRAFQLGPRKKMIIRLTTARRSRSLCTTLPRSAFCTRTTTTATPVDDDPELELSFRRQNMALAQLIRRGSLREARRVFYNLRQRNVVTWNTMLGAYVRHREVVRARDLFDRMPQRDVVSWNSMLLGYTLLGQLGEARQLFEDMPVRDAISWNTMVSGYAKCGRMDDALNLFEHMNERNVVSWNAIVTGFLENGDVKRALETYDRMTVRDSASLSALISGLVCNGRLEDAERALLKSEEKNVDAYNTLIAGFAQRGRVEEARCLFEMIPCHSRIMNINNTEDNRHWDRHFEKNVISWNAMIMCYVKAGDICSARILFEEMPRRDIFSWNTMINGYVQLQNLEDATSLFSKMPEPDSRTWNFMISGFAQKGDMERAREYFNQTPCKSIVSWNTIIAGYEQNDNYEEAMQLFSQMMLDGEKPDRHTLSSVLGACAGLTTLSQGVQIHQLITKTVKADTPINNALITMYSRCGNLTDARLVFNTMETQWDVVSWNAMIGGYAQHGPVEESLRLFREMKGMKVQPTHVTFISVLNACCHAGLVAEGRRHFNSMVHEYGITPHVEHYASLVDLIGRHGQLEDALGIIEGMSVTPDRAVWGALLGACRKHKNASMARVAVEALLEIDPDSSAPYVLLYNTHADLGSWDDAVEVRETMDRNGIRKQPGYSWIELQRSVHVFLSGNRSHPLANEIHSIADSFQRVIRDETHDDTLTESHVDG